MFAFEIAIFKKEITLNDDDEHNVDDDDDSDDIISFHFISFYCYSFFSLKISSHFVPAIRQLIWFNF